MRVVKVWVPSVYEVEKRIAKKWKEVEDTLEAVGFMFNMFFMDKVVVVYDDEGYTGVIGFVRDDYGVYGEAVFGCKGDACEVTAYRFFAPTR